jgi:hypothetical protein
MGRQNAATGSTKMKIQWMQRENVDIVDYLLKPPEPEPTQTKNRRNNACALSSQYQEC